MKVKLIVYDLKTLLRPFHAQLQKLPVTLHDAKVVYGMQNSLHFM
jgi:hypothetical protein